jgi:hypothetical protein
MAKQVPGNVRRLLSRIADGVYVTSITTPPKGFRGSVENWRQAMTQARRMGLVRTYRPNLKKDGYRLIEPSAKGYAVLG